MSHSHILNNAATIATQYFRKNISTSVQWHYKVTVAGAAGGIGQPLCLLLKLNPLVTQLACYDIAPVTPGVAVDISHVNTSALVTGYKGNDQLVCALKDTNVLVIPAGIPRKPGMSRDDLFNINASIVRDIVACAALNAPKAIIAIITNPVNSMVPIACEVLKKAKVLDPKRVLGVTTLDVVRASTFIGTINNVDPSCVDIPVIGGHSGVTIIPLLSRSNPQVRVCNQKDIAKLTKRIQEAGTEVVKAKAGGGSATLSMAYAGSRLVGAVLKGLDGVEMMECAYVKSNVSEASYFATPLIFGRCGVATNLGIGPLNDYEKSLLKAAIPELKKNIQTGEQFVNKC